MNQCDRIKLILQENKLKQKQFAAEISVTDSYISKLLKDSNIHMSPSLAALIEEKYGYNAEWILNGTEPKLKQVSKNKSLSELHQKALAQLEKMNDAQVKSVLAFIRSLEEIEKCFTSDREDSLMQIMKSYSHTKKVQSLHHFIKTLHLKHYYHNYFSSKLFINKKSFSLICRTTLVE